LSFPQKRESSTIATLDSGSSPERQPNTQLLAAGIFIVRNL